MSGDVLAYLLALRARSN